MVGVRKSRRGLTLFHDLPKMPPLLKINAVAFVSAQNFPILVRSFIGDNDDLKYHYLAHTSLDVIEERSAYLAVLLHSLHLT